MHRHGYKGKKFGRQRDQRQALIKGLADSLVLNESIETTLSKAKVAVSYTEKLITKAKKGGLHNRRQVISSLNTVEAAHKLVDELAPKLSSRNSGYLRIEKSGLRRGDGVQLAKVSFVDDLKAKPLAKKSADVSSKSTAVKKPTTKKTTAKDTK
ncbi:50S ribosomal protein L17 [Candidatus Saccharibacteria bacterium CG10_big_fil_rev_8_21_14_0_10_47_8]|nr:MAG: 50S ribosomal protein L17 [Candidatus Saccharibacteria bacterium CG10_big_fil_rev_8_21_14_0_10_47_8]